MYRRSGKLSLRYQSAQAAKRRNSVLALSTVDLSSGAANKKPMDDNGDDGDDDGVSSDESSSVVASSIPSSANPRRSYDAVYRTHEPLPGKPDVVFEPKVWDLDAEYEGQLEKVDKRTAIYVPGSPPAGSSSPAGRPRFPLMEMSHPAAAGPSVAVQKQILPSRFKDSF